MSKITHIGRNFSDINSGSKKVQELFPGLQLDPVLTIDIRPSQKEGCPTNTCPARVEKEKSFKQTTCPGR